jgi:hypothetical protein
MLTWHLPLKTHEVFRLAIILYAALVISSVGDTMPHLALWGCWLGVVISAVQMPVLHTAMAISGRQPPEKQVSFDDVVESMESGGPAACKAGTQMVSKLQLLGTAQPSLLQLRMLLQQQTRRPPLVHTTSDIRCYTLYRVLCWRAA